MTILIFTEFGSRVSSNVSLTDHGAGGGAFILGEHIDGGLYAEYPSFSFPDQDNGDLAFTYDFRGLYSTLLEQLLGIDPYPIVGGNYEQVDIFK